MSSDAPLEFGRLRYRRLAAHEEADDGVATCNLLVMEVGVCRVYCLFVCWLVVVGFVGVRAYRVCAHARGVLCLFVSGREGWGFAVWGWGFAASLQELSMPGGAGGRADRGQPAGHGGGEAGEERGL
jgi:hypothetical protein